LLKKREFCPIGWYRPLKMGGCANYCAAKNDFKVPDEPLYFLEVPSAHHPHGEPIRRNCGCLPVYGEWPLFRRLAQVQMV
jgi:hypothetical protein